MSEELDLSESDVKAMLAGTPIPSSLYSAREVAEKLLAATAELRRELEEVKRERDELQDSVNNLQDHIDNLQDHLYHLLTSE